MSELTPEQQAARSVERSFRRAVNDAWTTQMDAKWARDEPRNFMRAMIAERSRKKSQRSVERAAQRYQEYREQYGINEFLETQLSRILGIDT